MKHVFFLVQGFSTTKSFMNATSKHPGFRGTRQIISLLKPCGGQSLTKRSKQKNSNYTPHIPLENPWGSLTFVDFVQGGPRADRYKWSYFTPISGRKIFHPYKWPRINGFHCGYFTPYKWSYNSMYNNRLRAHLVGWKVDDEIGSLTKLDRFEKSTSFFM